MVAFEQWTYECTGTPFDYGCIWTMHLSTQMNRLFILVKSTEIRLYLSFSDWFGTNCSSVWFQINIGVSMKMKKWEYENSLPSDKSKYDIVHGETPLRNKMKIWKLVAIGCNLMGECSCSYKE